MEQNQEFIDRVREFNRFYTNLLGLLDRHFLATQFSLIEGRVLFEIHHTELCTAKKIRSNIEIDKGYLSRIVDTLIRKGLVRKAPAAEDKRLHLISLTEKGKKEFSKLNDNSNQQIARLVGGLTDTECRGLVEMMDGIRALLEEEH